MAMEEMKYTRWRENPADHCHHTREEAHGGCPVVCRWGLPRWPSGKESPANAGDIRDVGSIPGLGRSPGVGNGNPLRVLAWETPWAEEPGGLQSTGSERVGPD